MKVKGIKDNSKQKFYLHHKFSTLPRKRTDIWGNSPTTLGRDVFISLLPYQEVLSVALTSFSSAGISRPNSGIPLLIAQRHRPERLITHQREFEKV